MSASDLIYFRDGVTHRVAVYLESDSGMFVDLNWRLQAEHIGAYPDYYAGLIGGIDIDIGMDRGTGIYVGSTNRIVMSNKPWAGNPWGFWDAPLPVTIKRSATVIRTFSEFRGRTVRLGLWTYLQDGKSTVYNTLYEFLIDDIDTSSGYEAVISLDGRERLLQLRSAASVKQGSEPYQGHPIGALITRLVKAASAGFEIDSSIAEGQIDLGTLENGRASSWGRCPGILSDGSASVHHWVPRCLGWDAADPTKSMLVGLEAPGDEDTSGGAIGAFDAETGRWTVFQTSEGAPASLGTRHPIAVHSIDSTYVLAACVKERDPANHTGFYEIEFWRFHRTTGAGVLMGGPFVYWPARWSIREGDFEGSWQRHVGYTQQIAQYCGEDVPVPFPQTVDTLQDYIVGDTLAGFAQWNTNILGNGIGGGQAIVDDTPLGSTRLGVYGAYTLISQGQPNPVTAAVRFWMTDSWHPPVIGGDGSVDGQKWWYYISEYGQLWWIRAIEISGYSPYDTFSWGLSALGDGSTPSGSHLYHRQITAYCWDGSLASDYRRMLIATVEWRDTKSAACAYSRACLWEVGFNGVANGAQVPAGNITLKWSDTPSGSVQDDGWTIVGLWTPPANASDHYQSTGRYIMVVFFNRKDLRGSPYALGIWDSDKVYGPVWVSRPESSVDKGPRSARPFSGFVMNHETGRIHCIDQATGQCWSVDPETVSFRLENAAFPIHTKEHHVAVTAGHYLKPAAYDLLFWAMAPGPHGDVTMPYWQRDGSKPAIARYVEGLYPLIQFGRKAADAIEVAPFDRLNTFEAIGLLRQIAQLYTMRLHEGTTFKLEKREAGSSIGTLKLKSRHGVVAIEDDEIPVESYQKKVLTEEIVNAVDVTPYELVRAKPRKPEEIRAADSAFAGTFKTEVDTDRSIALRIICVAGGDMLQGSTFNKQRGILWRYEQTLQAVIAHLVVPATRLQSYVYVSDFSVRGDRFFCGEQRVRAGDTLKVMDGTSRAITALSVYGETAIKVDLDGSIDVDAASYATAKVTPRDGNAVSDSDEGVTTLAETVTPGATSFLVADASGLRVEMGIRVLHELMKITMIAGNTITVDRGQWGTQRNWWGSYPSGTPIQAFVATQQANRLYPVGDTNVRFGVQVEIDATEDDPVVINGRSVSVGDGVIVSTDRYQLEPMDGTVVRRENAASIDRHGRMDIQIPDNRFLSPVKAELVAINALDPWAHLGLFGIELPWYPTPYVGATMEASDAPMIPENGGSPQTVALEIVRQRIRVDDTQARLLLTLRSYEPVLGAGAEPPAVPRGYAVPRGERAEA